ncbi:MAG TPA: DUF1801 domain-containing protein [Dongiaceae bacterium]|jgi:hypothetical protein|nr:DUF1801 domain-containing protein [Dongiaceae bacterium]
MAKGAAKSGPAIPAEVAAAFDAFPAPVRRRLLQVRGLIFAAAAKLDGVGPLTETLKWGEPAYLTAATGSGSTIRLGWLRSSERPCAVLFNCNTTLVETFRERFPDAFAYAKNRAICLSPSGTLPKGPLSSCLALALTYHRRSTLK